MSYDNHSMLDRFAHLKVAFMEGGAGWLASLFDRAERPAILADNARRFFNL